jgi:hypothetical protein
MKHITLTLLIVATWLGSLFAQGNCSEQLRQAERRYDEGLLDDIPQMIKPCLNSGFTKEEKVNAYKLLIQTHLFSDDKQTADEEMYQFLKEFPEYAIASTDPKEFVNLYRTYRTDPILKIEASVGANLSMPSVKEYYGVESLNSSTPEYSSNAGVNVEVNYLGPLFGDFDGSFGFSFIFSRIGYWSEPYDFTSIAATYNDIYIGLPLALKYNKRLMGLDFFAKGGFEPIYLISSTINFTRELSLGQDPITGTENITQYQKRFDIRPLLSVGMHYNIGNAQLMLTAGVKFGTIMPTNRDKRYDYEDLYDKYYFIADDFFVHQTFISLSYIFSIYNPKKLK